VQEHVRAAGHAVDWFERLEPAEHASAQYLMTRCCLICTCPTGAAWISCASFARRGDALPVVILTARDLVSDRIEGLKRAPTITSSSLSISTK